MRDSDAVRGTERSWADLTSAYCARPLPNDIGEKLPIHPLRAGREEVEECSFQVTNSALPSSARCRAAKIRQYRFNECSHIMEPLPTDQGMSKIE